MFIYATILAIFVAIYVIGRAIFPIKTNIGNKLAFSAIAAAAAFKFHIFYLIEGENFFSPHLPAEMIWGGCWAFCAVFAFALLLLAADVVRLPLYLGIRLAGRKPHHWRRTNNRINLFLLLLAMGTSAWGTWSGVRAPEVREVTIQLPHMAADTKPLRMVQLTDLHADSTKDADFYRDIVKRTNALNPDIVVITGDFADGGVSQSGAALAPLCELKAPMGVYCVTGNHDYFWGFNSWQYYLRSLNIHTIDGKIVVLHRDNGDGTRTPLQLVGVHDPMSHRTVPSAPTLKELADNMEPGIPTVLLAHQPRIADQAARYGFDLQLSGHTHGGQFPGLQQLVERFNNGYVRGLYQVGSMQLYVSAGTSLWTPICMRLGIPSEITLLHLVPAQQGR